MLYTKKRRLFYTYTHKRKHKNTHARIHIYLQHTPLLWLVSTKASMVDGLNLSGKFWFMRMRAYAVAATSAAAPIHTYTGGEAKSTHIHTYSYNKIGSHRWIKAENGVRKKKNRQREEEEEVEKIVLTEIYEKVRKIRGRLWSKCMGELKLKWIMMENLLFRN